MGLAEKRWILERKTSDEGKFQQDIKEAVGKSVPIEIDWESFSTVMSDVGYLSNDSHGLPQLVVALKQVASDDLGKEGLKKSLKKIIIKAAKSESTSFVFKDGTVTWSAYFGSSSTGYIYADEMVKKIEAEL